MAKKVDYREIKKEYCTTNATIGQLAKKYGLAKSSISRKIKAEGWDRKRAECYEKATDRQIDSIIVAQGDAWERTQLAMLRILDKKLALLEQGKGDVTYPQMAKAIKDMRDMGMFGPTIQEQKNNIEIKKMEKELAEDGDKNPVIEVLMEDVEEFVN